VEFAVENDGQVTLKFGPMSMDDLIDMLVHLGTDEGQTSFLTLLNDALLKEVQREREQVEQG
jgi:hypothetical protein